jgi:hypothetical protein
VIIAPPALPRVARRIACAPDRPRLRRRDVDLQLRVPGKLLDKITMLADESGRSFEAMTVCRKLGERAP